MKEASVILVLLKCAANADVSLLKTAKFSLKSFHAALGSSKRTLGTDVGINLDLSQFHWTSSIFPLLCCYLGAM